MDRVFDEVAILDYMVTVEYSEPGQNHSVAYIKMADGYEGKLLGQLLPRNKPLDNWQKWIPKDATAYSIHQGLSLHALYDGLLKFVHEEFPDAQPQLDKFAAWQEHIDVNIDRDILQSFTGDTISVTMPVTIVHVIDSPSHTAEGSNRSVSVIALKCQNPEKIRELINRAVEALNNIPAFQMQQLKLEDCSQLEGFKGLHSALLQLLGVQPVVGFRDGWMIVATNPEAAEKLLDVRAGKIEAIDAAATFAKFSLESNQPIYNVEFKDIGAQVRDAADVIDKFGAMAPMFLSMAAANAKPEEIKPLQETVALLPSVAKFIRKFDFYGNSLCVTRPGPQPGTYLKECVTEVQLPDGRNSNRPTP